MLFNRDEIVNMRFRQDFNALKITVKTDYKDATFYIVQSNNAEIQSNNQIYGSTLHDARQRVNNECGI